MIPQAKKQSKQEEQILDYYFRFQKYSTKKDLIINEQTYNTNNSIRISLLNDYAQKAIVILTQKWVICHKKIDFQKLKNILIFLEGNFVFQKNKFYLILNDLSTNFMIIDTDWHIKATELKTFQTCERKLLLNHLYPSFSGIGEAAAVNGQIYHSIFQKIMLEQTPYWSINIQQLFEEYQTLYCFYFSQLKDQELCQFKQELEQFVFSSCQFLDTYLVKKTPIKNQSRDLQLVFLKALNPEYRFQSQKYGFKGSIDLLFETEVTNLITKEIEIQTIAFELKTGKNKDLQFSSQVIIYNLCLNERYIENSVSVIYYSLHKEFVLVQNKIQQIVEIFIQRNQIVNLFYLDQLPQTIDNEKICDMCKERDKCIYETLNKQSDYFDFIEIDQIQIKEKSLSKTIRLLSNNQLINTKYLLELKNKIDGVQKEIDFRKSNNQQKIYHKKKMIFSNMDSLILQKDQLNESIYYLDFIIELNIGSQKQGIVLDDLFIGKMLKIKSNSNYYLIIDGKINQRYFFKFAGLNFLKILIECWQKVIKNLIEQLLQKEDQVTQFVSKWHISEEEDHNFKKLKSLYTELAFNNMNSYLNAIFINNQLQNSNQSNSQENCISKFVLNQNELFNQCNPVQQEIIYKSLNTSDFFVIRGFPGCGKTFTIVASLQFLLQQGKKTLLCCYTHKALDLVSDKLFSVLDKDQQKDVIKLVESRNDYYKNEFEIFNIQNIENYTHYEEIMNKKIFIVTINSLKKFCFPQGFFEYVFIDEASQIVEPLLIEAFKVSQKQILVGDDKQLQPLLMSSKNILSKSLFSKLIKQFPQKCSNLNIQYRMNEQIMDLINNLYYENQIKKNMIIKQEKRFDFKIEKLPLKMAKIFQNQNQVKYINVQSDFKDNQVFPNNIFENSAIEIYQELLQQKIQPEQISIITTYNNQLNFIQTKVKKQTVVLTIDWAQGSENSIIILILGEFQNTETQEKENSIINSNKRLNVALSRAQDLLFIISNNNTLMQFEKSKKLLHFLHQKRFTIDFQYS